MSTRYVSLTHFWTFEPPLGAPKRPLCKQIKPFWNPRRSKKCMYRVQNAFYLWWPPRWSILDQIGSIWAIQWPFQRRKGHIWDYWGLKTACFAHVNSPLGASREGPKVPKWVSDIYFVNIGHLDHHVVFGTKFGIVQDFQRGKKGPIWVQQNPLDLP